MGWSVVQSKCSSETVSGTTASVTFNSNTTTGNSLFVVVRAGAAVTVSSISINAGSASFSSVIAQANGSSPVEIWAAANITGGTTPQITVTCSGSFGNTGSPVAIYEASGGPNTITTDGTNSTTGTSTALTTNSITTTVSGDLVIKGFSCGGTANGTAESGWTEFNPDTDGNVAGYIVQSSSGSITGTDTQSPSSAFTGAIAAFKAASGTTTLNSTWTSNPKATLTLNAQVIRDVTMGINPKVTLTMNNSVLADVKWTSNPKATLTLNDQVLRLLTTNINPKPSLSFLSQQIQQSNININPKATLTLSPKGIATVGNLNPYGLARSFWGGGYTDQ